MDSASIGRSSGLFPTPDDDLYGASHVLSGAVQPLRLRDGFLPRWGDARLTFKRIVTLHATAFEAERAAAWDRAEFYWTELWRLIAESEADHRCWDEGLAYVERPGPGLTALDVRSSFLNEVVIPSHGAFFRSQVEAGLDPLDHPRLHLDGISRVLKALAPTDVQGESMLVDALGAIALNHYGGEREGEVERLCFAFAEYFPRQTHYLEAALGRLHARTTSQLEKAKDVDRRAILDDAIQQVERVRLSVPSSLSCYQFLGLLYHRLSIVLAELTLISEAMVASRKAEVFGGDEPAVRDVRQQLDDILQIMRRQVKQVEATLRQGGVALSEEGRQLVRQCTIGSTAADGWIGSQQAKEIRALRERATPTTLRPPAASLMSIARISLLGTNKVKSHERTADMLASRGAWRLRLQVVVAVLLASVAALLAGQDGWNRHLRRQAFDKIQIARAANDDAATLNALAEFFDAQGRRGDAAEAVLAPVYTETLSRWFRTRIGGLSPEDHLVLDQYRRQIVSRGLDSVEVKP
jgi:hypothetical protein